MGLYHMSEKACSSDMLVEIDRKLDEGLEKVRNIEPRRIDASRVRRGQGGSPIVFIFGIGEFMVLREYPSWLKVSCCEARNDAD